MRQRCVIVVKLILVSALAGCSAASSNDAVAAREPAATDQCAAPEFPTVQAGLHLIGDREPPVAYSSTPPTSGWHRSGVARPGVATSPLTEPVQVGLLEAGVVVVSHGDLEDEQRADLSELADRFPDSVAVTPYGSLADGQVAAAGWGVLQRCTGVDVDALARFVEFYGDADGADAHAATPGAPAPAS